MISEGKIKSLFEMCTEWWSFVTISYLFRSLKLPDVGGISTLNKQYLVFGVLMGSGSWSPVWSYRLHYMSEPCILNINRERYC